MADNLLNPLDLTGQQAGYQRFRSMLGAILERPANRGRLVAFLVALFSLVIPAGLMLALSYLPEPALSCSLRNMADRISRWSMADVFVVGIFVAVLAANVIRREGGLLGLEATLGSGFYFFWGFACPRPVQPDVERNDRISDKVAGPGRRLAHSTIWPERTTQDHRV